MNQSKTGHNNFTIASYNAAVFIPELKFYQKSTMCSILVNRSKTVQFKRCYLTIASLVIFVNLACLSSPPRSHSTGPFALGNINIIYFVHHHVEKSGCDDRRVQDKRVFNRWLIERTM